MVTLDVLGPFQVLKPKLTLPARETKSDSAGAERAGPLVWWKLDETEGSSLVDAAENRTKGQIHGPPHWIPAGGVQSGALEFDGTQNWVEGESEGLELSKQLTVSTWFKVRHFAQTPQSLIAKGDAWELQCAGKEGCLEFALTGPENTEVNRGRSPTITSRKTVKDGQWHHAVGVYNGRRVTLYLDGEVQGSVAASGPLALNNLPVTLGENSVSRGRLFNGWLDDPRIYGRALSAEEVAVLYRAIRQ